MLFVLAVGFSWKQVYSRVGISLVSVASKLENFPAALGRYKEAHQCLELCLELTAIQMFYGLRDNLGDMGFTVITGKLLNDRGCEI